MRCVQFRSFFRNQKQRRERVLRKMAAMRAAKERKRLAGTAPDREPKLVPWFPLEFAVRDKVTGETVWLDLKSDRDVFRRVTVLLRYYQPGRASKDGRNEKG